MFVDSLLKVSAAQALTATAVCTDKIDLTAPAVGPQIATGEPMGFCITVDVAADHTTGDETYEVDIVSDGDSALGSPTTHGKFVLAYTDLVLGKRHILPLPQGIMYERYLGVKYVLGGTTPTVTLSAIFGPLKMLSIEPIVYTKGFSV